jgi:hypothetical protein
MNDVNACYIPAIILRIQEMLNKAVLVIVVARAPLTSMNAQSLAKRR